MGKQIHPKQKIKSEQNVQKVIEQIVYMHKQRQTKKHKKNLSNIVLTRDQTNLLAKGLKFIPIPKENETQIRCHLFKDFNNFARRMRLQYIFFWVDHELHPFHFKSDWILPVQPSVSLESYLEEVKVQLAEILLTKPKDNLPDME